MKKAVFSLMMAALLAVDAFALGGGQWVYVKDCEGNLTSVFIQGVYEAGSNTTEPRAAKSKYFQVEKGGATLMGDEVGFSITVFVWRNPKRNLLIEIEYPNPADPSKPLKDTAHYEQQGDRFQFRSSEGIKGIVGYQDYEIKLRAYDLETNELVDSLSQRVRSYLDTQEKDVRILKKALNSFSRK